MKKNIFIVAFIFTVFAQAMEQENKWSITVYGTKINLNKGNMLDTYADGTKKVDFIVVGHYTQSSKFSYSERMPFIGQSWEAGASEVFFATDKDDNNYKVVSYHTQNGKKITKALFPVPRGYNVCIKTGEPCVELYRYCNDDEAIKWGLQDVGVCYAKVLAYIAEQNDKKLVKSIALPTLGVEKYTSNFLPKDKAAPVAVETILEFIKNNPSLYDRIELFVEEDFEVDLYKELFMQWRGKENVLLLYFGQKDPENIIALLPPELVGYIARLI